MVTSTRAVVRGRAVPVRELATTVPVLAVVGGFVATRLALLWRFPPFFDEALYASWALRVHDSADDRFVALANGKLPLLSWLGAGGVFAGVEPLTAVRLVSVAAGAASLALASLLAAELGGRPAAIAAGATFVLLPLAVVHDVMGLMEPLVGALLVLALYLQIRLARAPSATFAMLLGLTLGAALLTKETGALALALLPFSLLLFDWEGPRLGRRLAGWLAAALGACLLAAVARLVLALSEHWPDYGDVQSTFGTFRSVREGLAHPLRWLGDAWPGYRPELGGYITVTLGIAALAGAGIALGRHRRVALLYLIWLGALFALDVLFLTNSYARYLVPAAPLVAVFVGLALAELVRVSSRIWPGRSATAAAAVVVAAAFAPAVWLDAHVVARPGTAPYPGLSREEYASGWAAGTGWRELADVLRREARDRATVVAMYGRASPALPLLLRGETGIEVLQPGDEAAAQAAFAVANAEPLPADAGEWTLRPVWEFERPHRGTRLALYRRGVLWHGRFFSRPDDLRSGLGLDDSSFDRFLAENPVIRDWYLTMTAQEQSSGA